MAKTEILIASKNMHKIRELKELLSAFPEFDILSLFDFPDYVPEEETGTSFRENAETKAIHAAKVLNKLAIGEDSGLVVPALNNKPGIFSARYAGKNATDGDNRKKLLTDMENLEDDKRYAFFESCMAIATPEGLKKSTCATCEGRIIKKEKGGSGFGYDPIFIKNDYSKTFAELQPSLKNQISHRRKAFDKLLITLESLQCTI